jgi:hypothetical protein
MTSWTLHNPGLKGSLWESDQVMEWFLCRSPCPRSYAAGRPDETSCCSTYKARGITGVGPLLRTPAWVEMLD